MAREGVLISATAKRSGVSRKALRPHEAAGILPPPRRTPAGYRVYGFDTPNLLSFIRRAQRLGFTLAEITDIVALRRAGGVSWPHIRA